MCNEGCCLCVCVCAVSQVCSPGVSACSGVKQLNCGYLSRDSQHGPEESKITHNPIVALGTSPKWLKMAQQWEVPQL